MAKWALKANGEVFLRRTCRPLQVAERNSLIEMDVSIQRGFIGYIGIFNDFMILSEEVGEMQ